jgi:galactokinase
MTLGAAADVNLARTFTRVPALNMRQRVILPGVLLTAARALLDNGVPSQQPCRAFFVPGRIEVLGKHTDYGGGPSVVCAVERGIVIVACERRDGAVVIRDAQTGQSVSIGNPDHNEKEPGWARYTGAVVMRVARDFAATWRGANIAFYSNLPIAAGLSSSSALVIATFLALDAVQQISSTAVYKSVIQSPEDLSEYLAAVERGAPFRGLDAAPGVGTLSGSEDHTAILCSQTNRVMHYTYLPTKRAAAIELPQELTFAVGVSGVVAEKTGAAMGRYNRLSLQVTRLEQLWHTHIGEVLTLRDILQQPAGYEQLRDTVEWHAGSEADDLLRRLAQYREETEQLIPRALRALRSMDYGTLRLAVQRSQQLAEEVLQNQIEETSWLAERAITHGALAASAFGAGFGGSVWALVRRDNTAKFMDAWTAAYIERFPQHEGSADFWFTDAGPSATELTPG